ncbi:hypothetical protein [Pseudoalteromonas umbrosa]|uniref:hypothetical protein n=1 Tax=Pseudoalteromonas umbrosa TaxID=3048489 RepID=UPI0024C4589F|nr:hypothetical protein [Pseudoalteromonas sp. B95]MDK1286057.1 hypothetical protein [Pseudoalteromonas sp. B95]
MKGLNLLMVFVLLFSAFYVAAGDKYYIAYGSNRTQAESYIYSYAQSNNYTVTSMYCVHQSAQLPWKCTGALSKQPVGQLITVSAYGGSEASATTNVIRAWREAANSSSIPTSFQCQRVGLGSVWQCTARSYA